MNTLLQHNKIRNATHNILAYRIFVEDRDAWLQVCSIHMGICVHPDCCALMPLEQCMYILAYFPYDSRGQSCKQESKFSKDTSQQSGCGLQVLI